MKTDVYWELLACAACIGATYAIWKWFESIPPIYIVYRTCAVACSCSAGFHHHNPPTIDGKTYRALPQYDPNKMVACERHPTEADIERLEDHCQRVWGGRRESAFDSFNNGTELPE